MKRLLTFALFLALLTPPATPQSRPGSLAVLPAGLAEDSIEVKINYSGARIVLFAGSPASEDATTGLAVALIGPTRPTTVVRNVEGEQTRFQFVSAPAVFVTGAEDRVRDTVDQATLAAAGLDPGASAIPQRSQADNPDLAAWRAALVGLKARQDDYLPSGATIERLEGGLRRARMRLPPDSPPGRYRVRAVMFQDGRPIGQAEHVLTLVRGGMDATMYDLATKHGLAYGFIAVVLGVVVGGAAIFVGRR
jgi:uncharacterized protein (TIGR02186 family)